jgi:hypothetical protein
MNKIIRVYFNTDLRNGIDGLNDMNKEKVGPGEFVVFINSKLNKMKVLVAKNAYLNFRSPEGGRIHLSMIRYIPKYFNGSQINFDGALKESLNKEGIA